MKKLLAVLSVLVVAAGTVFVASSGNVAVAATATVQAQRVRIAVLDNVTLSVTTDRVIVTGVSVPTITGQGGCFEANGFGGVVQGFHIVAVNPQGTPGGKATLTDAFTNDALGPGSRLVNLAQIITCTEPNGDTYKIYEADLASPIPGGNVLVAAPAGVMLLSGDDAVVKKDADQYGNASAVCIQPRSAAVNTQLWSTSRSYEETASPAFGSSSATL